MTTRKEIEAKCEELAVHLTNQDLLNLITYTPYELFIDGTKAALDLTWPMIKELSERNKKLLEDNVHIENRVLNKAADFTTKRQLEMNKERDQLKAENEKLLNDFSELMSARAEIRVLLAKLKVYEEALEKIHDYPGTTFGLGQSLALIAEDALEQAKGMK
jgi:hypothetical protein